MLNYTNYEKVKVSGNDRDQFLQSMLTQDIKALKPGDHAEAAFLTAQGRVLAYMVVFTYTDFHLLVIEPGHTDKTIEMLSRFIITEDVTLENVTSSFTDSRLKQGEHDLTKQEEQTWRVREGLLRFGIDFDDTIILSETGLEKVSVSETKGCYPGQEVIAKIETYDGLNRKFFKLELDSEHVPEKGAKLFLDNVEMGFITSACSSDHAGKIVALCYVQRKAWGRLENLSVSSKF